jgi:hypothetical protein
LLLKAIFFGVLIAKALLVNTVSKLLRCNNRIAIYFNLKVRFLKILFALVVLSITLSTSGCVSLVGITGANEGQLVDGKWMEYDVKHPGLDIKIIEPYSPDLLPISSVGKSSPLPLTHTVLFGRESEPHELKIVGQYKKEIYLDGKSFGEIWLGSILINDGILTIDDIEAAKSAAN